ncbi:MAG: hypothetical protein GY950_31640 [bacterium]|nr:hypothetical protein [bacterium]
MDQYKISAKKHLEKKLGAVNAALFIKGLKDIYQNGKYYGDYYNDIAMKAWCATTAAKRR